MAALAFSPTAPKRYQTVTVTGTAFAATTALTVVVSHQSIGAESIPVTTNGSGAFTCTFVADGTGTINVAVNGVPSTVTTVFSSSVNVKGD